MLWKGLCPLPDSQPCPPGLTGPQPCLLPAGAGGDHHHPPALLLGSVGDSQAVSPVPLSPRAGLVLSLPGQATAGIHVPDEGAALPAVVS